MDPQSVTNAFQKVLSKLETPEITGDFPTQFALKRFVKKFEVPDRKSAKERKLKTFANWYEYDQSLKAVVLPHGAWYRTRLSLHENLKHFRIGELTFTGGSSSSRLNGLQSIPRKLLTHEWECSPGCADLFVSLAIHDKCFVKAAKMRYRKLHGDEVYKSTVKRIFMYNRDPADVKKYLLYASLTERDVSRYSTVRKNNEIDRSIDLQPFVNMLTQRAIGLGLRHVIKKSYGVDLTKAAQIHRLVIRCKRAATIDLHNASDSNTWSLCRFLLPPWFVSLLQQATPTFVEGLDKNYYLTKKVSSMGNGFTFELMSLILLAFVRQFDSDAIVFGDDIIVDNSVAQEVILGLQSAGWVVNEQKSFISGPFRESCGANYHDEYGYIRSFDFMYPTHIGEVAVFWNKCVLLKHIPFFNTLSKLLYRTIPVALRGPFIPSPTEDEVAELTGDTDLPDRFFLDLKPKEERRFSEVSSDIYEGLNWPYVFRHIGFKFNPKIDVRSRDSIQMSRHPLLYFQYIYGLRVTPLIVTGTGDWVRVGFISNGSYSIREKNVTYLTKVEA